ncbi:hypothetical protein GQ54DRAFT_261371 [Martensiomyces pterosporus]|nr:hypothetical protein GQ54DRAFT_261371 [Martensiomyces pterosporus]
MSGGTKLLSREEQRELILKLGGRILKFTNNGGELYFRYYFPHPDQLTWRQLVDGLRLLFGIASQDLYITYKDDTGSRINVTDDGGLKIMFEETRDSDTIHIEVVADGRAGLSMSSEQQPPSIDAAPTISMPMPSVGFPGMPPSRADSVLSEGSIQSSQPMPPQQQPPIMNTASSQHPGPVPMAMQQHLNTGGPVRNSGQTYGRVSNDSNLTLPPPRPQKPLDEL